MHCICLPCPALPCPAHSCQEAPTLECDFGFDCCIDAIAIANPSSLYTVCLLAKYFSFMFGYIILMTCSCWGSHLDVHPRLKSPTLHCFSVLVHQELEKFKFVLVQQELEKFKFVLDYKIKELKKQIEPKEEQIADMKDQVKVRCAELCCAAPCCAALR